MNRKIKILSFIFASFLSFSTVAFAIEPKVDSYKLNGKEESVKLNPSLGDVVSIEIGTNVLVKFSRIYVCKSEDGVCDDESSLIYFTKTNDPFVSSVVKLWDGKPSDTKKSKGMTVSDGDYKIKVKMKDEISTEYKYIQELSPYIITIDSNFSGGSGGSSSSSSVSSESSSSQSLPVSSSVSNSGSSSFISTHSDSEDLSASSKSSSRFEVNSGRNRMAYVGAPIVFSDEAVVIPKESEGQSVKFVWSFGDGSVAEGKKVSHTYKFAGDYVVVLNASLPDLSAVSRTSVKVVNPSVVISNVSGDLVEVWNKGAFEINLNGWLISTDRGKFIFPQDTIITPNKKIAFPDEYMKLNLAQGGKVSLLNPSQKEINSHLGVLAGGVSTVQVFQGASSGLDNDPVVMKIRDFIAKANKVSVEKVIAENKIPVKADDKLLTKKEKNLTATVIANDNKTVSSSTQTATVISNSSNDSREGGFLKSIFSLPSSGFNFIREKFYSVN